MAKKTPRAPSARKPKRGDQDATSPEEDFRDALVRTVIAGPLLKWFDDEEREPPYDVIIDLNLDYKEGREGARRQVLRIAWGIVEGETLRRGPQWPNGFHETKSELTQQYVFATLTEEQIRELVHRDGREDERAIYRIWPDFPLEAHISHSVATIKCDAARISFSAFGEGVVWAVLDSGIDGDHIHFQEHRNLDLTGLSIDHQDFTGSEPGSALTDEFGHGTHVAGIIAGEVLPPGYRREDRVRAAELDGEDAEATPMPSTQLLSAVRRKDESGEIASQVREIDAIAGMAPKARLVSLKVLDERGDGKVSNLIAAVGYIQEINGHGRRLQIHGVNMSVGYNFDPEWFACGHSPLCVEVDRLVSSGVVVVVAAGNTGYGKITPMSSGPPTAGLDLTINDPGNADKAITVGSTHRDSPHTYGVSYFSSKGPTGDGRIKPDLVAPGEKIVSCAAGRKRQQAESETERICQYREESGTSMAAPHVSGAVAAFLSVRREFQGRPEAVKRVFLDSATGLGRERYFQGHGLVDLMRAIQSV